MDGQSGVTTRGIFKAMHAVMSEVGVIGKDRKNPQQGYQFRGIDDVLAVLQPLFIKHGVFCVPKVLKAEREVLPTKSGGSMASVRLLVEHTFFASDGSSVYATTYGEAMDAGDKASNKAMSAALKYALTESFAIPTKESDRDTEEQSPELAGKAPGSPATAKAAAAQRSPGTPRPAPKPAAQSGAKFPNYGTAKNQPVAGATKRDLEFYRGGCVRTLADPSKSNFHERDRQLLAAIDDELSRHGRSAARDESAGDMHRHNEQAGNGDPLDNDEPPPPTDDDRQF